MFLDRLTVTNPALADLAMTWHREGVIQPDTYVLDLDTIAQNAAIMQASADAHGITLYYMLKQIGRNPLAAQAIQSAGMFGAVCVDWREALALSRCGIRLGNVGHLVQTPVSVLPEILAARPDIVTIYSVEKAAQIGAEARRQGFDQPVMLRVLGDADTLYPGQYGGFRLDGLGSCVDALERIEGIRIAGVCSFPCLLFCEKSGKIDPLPNMQTVRDAAAYLERRGYTGLQLNMPSASCVETIPVVASHGGTHMEPGHALTGTTPFHAAHPAAPERIGYVYVSEISHNLDGHAYCFGGGHYRRGHLSRALVGSSLDSTRVVSATPPEDACIDYHFALGEPACVGDTVLMCFRSQMFVTRSEVAVASGLSCGKPRLEGVFNTAGARLR